MQRIGTAKYYSNAWEVEKHEILRIYVYTSNGEKYKVGGFALEDENRNYIDDIDVLKVKSFEKSFKKQELEDEFIQKQMKEEINFYILDGEKGGKLADRKAILFLFADNEFIKIIENEVYSVIKADNYSLSKRKETYRKIKLDIDGKIAVKKIYLGSEEIDTKAIQEEAKALFKEIYPIAYINESEFNRIFNEYELVKREKPLVTEEC